MKQYVSLHNESAEFCAHFAIYFYFHPTGRVHFFGLMPRPVYFHLDHVAAGAAFRPHHPNRKKLFQM
jgi:hypothetical protein